MFSRAFFTVAAVLVFTEPYAAACAALENGPAARTPLGANPAGANRTPAPATDVTAACELVRRVTPAVAQHVVFRLDAELPGFRLSRHGEGILIEAADAARLIAGYGHYLKTVANCHLSWNGDRIPLRVPLPAPREPLTVGANPWKIRFAYNYCALSYSAAFWDWPRWERELDFLALQGFTHVLVTAGLEQVWADVLEQRRYPREIANCFIAHPAYAAWWHMGNIEGLGGPVSEELRKRQALLGRRIAARARQLGMNPVIQGFMGLVPSNYHTNIMCAYQQGEWCGFQRPSFLHPTVNFIFQFMAEQWYNAVERVYGFRPTWFAGDLFHEGGNRAGLDEGEVVQAVQRAMQLASPGSTWVLQAWGGNPSPAFLRNLDPSHTLILNLVKDMHGGDAPGRDFGGIPWLWCEVANFGGNNGLYGGLPLLARLGPALAAERPRGLAGLGLLSEGLETNPLYYDVFFTRLTTIGGLNLDEQLTLYARRRYGTENPHLAEALRLLANGLYNPDRRQEGCTESIVCARPGWLVAKASTWSTANRYYSPAHTLRAARLLLKAGEEEPALRDLPTYRYDLVDVVRQALADAAYDQLQLVRDAYEKQRPGDYDRESAAFLAMLGDLDALLDTVPAFRLEEWTRRAAAMGTTPEEKATQLRLAKQLVTTWAAPSQQQASATLNDYANRQWSGLVAHYYLPRWGSFFHAYRRVLRENAPPGQAAASFAEACRAHEEAFLRQDLPQGGGPRREPHEAAARLLSRWGARLDRLAENSIGPGRALPWEIPPGASEARLDVTDLIVQTGDYHMAVTLPGGVQPFWDRVVLYEGEKEVAQAPLDARGKGCLHLGGLRTNLTAYTLRIRLGAQAAAPLRGTLTLRPES